MLKPLQNILFATDLSEDCRDAFDYAAALATRFQATIVLLHVIEKMPDYVEGRLRGLMGKQQYASLMDSQQKSAQDALIGKKSTSRFIREALSQFCSQAGIDDDACGYHSREIVISDGEVVDDIISYSKKHNCELIVMGARHGMISKTSIGNTIKSVLRQSKIPVMVVPPTTEAGEDTGK